jgi:hypothetical protein
MATHFSGPVVSTNGFTGDVTGAVTATTVAASTSVAVGGGIAIKKIATGTIAVNPASCNNAAASETQLTLTGVATGDIVILVPPAAGLTAGLVAGDCRVTAADTIKVRIANVSGGTVDEASANWTYLWFDLT